jgi:hypothetical protein
LLWVRRPERNTVLSADNLIGPHHFVVLMFEDVAMPNIAKLLPRCGPGALGEIKFLNDACDVARIGLDRIFPRRTLDALYAEIRVNLTNSTPGKESYLPEGAIAQGFQLWTWTALVQAVLQAW